MDIQRIKDILSKDGSFSIIAGNTYTIDEMGSSLALYLALKSSGKNVSIISSKQPLVEVSNLVGIDKVKPNFESLNGDLVVSFPYRDDEIGKVSYTLEAGFLNIIVKPKDSALSFGESDVLFKRSGDVPAVIIAVGVKRLSDLSSLFAVEALKDTAIINIDKADSNEGFGDVAVLGQGSSSVSEQVANLLLTLGMPIDQDMAQNLMSGLISATGNFQSPRTSSLAFEMAGVLLRNGARRESIRPQAQVSQNQPNLQRNPQQRYPQQRINNQSQRTQAQAPLQAQIPQPSQVQPRPQQQVREMHKEQRKDDFPASPVIDDVSGQDAPPDWLSPKIFKGSTNVE